MSRAEIEVVAKGIIERLGASGPADKGKVMPAIMARAARQGGRPRDQRRRLGASRRITAGLAAPLRSETTSLAEIHIRCYCQSCIIEPLS